jgi:hypothetical protein
MYHTAPHGACFSQCGKVVVSDFAGGVALRVGTATRRRVRAYKRGRCYFATDGRLLPCPMAKLAAERGKRDAFNGCAQWTRSEKQTRIVRSKRIL